MQLDMRFLSFLEGLVYAVKQSCLCSHYSTVLLSNFHLLKCVGFSLDFFPE